MPTTPDVFLYRVDGGAWVDELASSTFTDTGTVTYGGSGDAEYADYESANSEYTAVDSPPDLTVFDGQNDWTIAVKIQASSVAVSGGQPLSIGNASFGSEQIYFQLLNDETCVFRADLGAANLQINGTTDVVDGTDKVLVMRYLASTDTLYAYINGTEESSVTVAGTDTTTFNQMHLGTESRASPGGGEYHEDRIYWAAGWASDIGTSEIAELDDSDWPFSGGSSSILPLLNAYYG